MAEGLLGRWSQRKQAVRAGTPLADDLQQKTALAQVNQAQAATFFVSEEPSGTADTTTPNRAAAQPQPTPTPTPTPTQATPALTLDDVQALKPDDSFARFVAPDVAPQVRNAAMKKLFTDPHYNVMDGLDIYIDDYSIPSPLPAATLRQMASAKFLNLFDEDPPEPEGNARACVGEDAHTAPAPSVAQSNPANPTASASLDTSKPPLATHAANLPTDHPIQNTVHDNFDLRLQPDPTAGPARLERQSERAPDAAQQPVPPRGR